MPFTKIQLPKKFDQNQLFHGDNLEVMQSLPSNSIDLIYSDPPFFSQRNYSSESQIDIGEVRQFTDTFESLPEYLEFLHPRIMEMHRLLKSTGSIYIHLDWHASHYVKVMTDQIFGYDNFKNNIVWCYNDAGRGKCKWASKHDDILFYTKSDNYVFNLDDVKIKHDKSFSDTFKEDPDDPDHRKYYTKYGKKYYVDGKIPEDWWTDIPSLPRTPHNERTDYPTQKPEALLEKIIKASSNPGNTVADFFGGSGVTASVANRLNRRWITCDISQKSIDVIKTRLFGNKSIKDKGFQPTIMMFD